MRQKVKEKASFPPGWLCIIQAGCGCDSGGSRLSADIHRTARKPKSRIKKLH
jgi:hypothetical protein